MLLAAMMEFMRRPTTLTISILAILSSLFTELHSDEIPRGVQGHASHIAPFFKQQCVRCHGDSKQKGEITLHDLPGDFSADPDVDRWEAVLEMLDRGEMPPEDQPQPTAADRQAVIQWIELELRELSAQRPPAANEPTVRRLTNFEYQNTMRDLLGFELKLSDSLPKDPAKPYRFNNTAEFMRMGPEQIDQYLECAHRAMASAIVNPVKPEVHKTRREWKPSGVERGLGADEIAIWGNRRNTPGKGFGLPSFPATGEFRIRVQASAILPPGMTELPLRLVMGYGLDINSSTQQMEPVGTIRLTNNPDHPEIFELVGRIENYPVQKGVVRKNKRQPDTLVITPQNLYDDGTLNDENLFLKWPRKLAMPRAVVNWIEFEAPITEVWPPAHHTRILFDSPLRESDRTAYVSAVLNRFMSRAYRRPASEAEVQRFTEVFKLISPEMDTFEAAIRETLAMVLISPQFLYHTVAEAGVTSRPYEMASRLSYFLWGSMPDEELLRLAAENRLDDAQVIEQQVGRMLADARSRDFVENFTKQWLSLEKMQTVPINRELFPRFLYYVPKGERAGTEEPYRPTIRDYMLAETVGFVAELIRQNASVANIIDSDFAFLNQPLAAHYGVDGVQGHELRPVPIQPEHRLGGLLTQGAVLIGNGTGSAPHPIYRAVWLREAILGDEVPAPPADVPALSDSAGESAEQALTIKDLLAAHRKQESCNDCHVRLDPWGIPFERYNAIGKFQAMVPEEGARISGFDKARDNDLAGYAAYLQSINTVEVEATARVPNGPLIEGMPQLKAYLLEHRTNEIVENVLRRLLSYGLGRELNWRDRFVVEELLTRGQANNHRLQDMIVSICQSKVFRRE